MKDSYCMVMTTCGSLGEAHDLAGMLVERKLAACVQMVNVTSMYRWEGKVTQDSEMLLLIKTVSSRYPEVETAIRERHSYTVPEIIQVPLAGGYPPYLAWIDESTR